MTIQDVLGRSDLQKLRADAVCLVLWRMAKGKENERVKTSSEDVAALITTIGIPTNASQALVAITKCRESSSIELLRGGPGRPGEYRVTAATRKRALQSASDFKTDLLPEPPKEIIRTTDNKVHALKSAPESPTRSLSEMNGPQTMLGDATLIETEPIAVPSISPSAIAEALFQMIADAESTSLLRIENAHLQTENATLKASASTLYDFTGLQSISTKAVTVLKTLAARSGGGGFEADSLRSWLASNLDMKPFEVLALAEALEKASKGA